MKYSQLNTKTNKTAKELDSINATLLQKAGFVDQVMAGVYTFLPLGYRVLKKIEQIVREEMDPIAAEIFMPSIVPGELWEVTKRKETVDVLFKVVAANAPSKAKNDAEYILNCTHEEVVTPLAQKFNVSYKDLPSAYYQIQSKFRNEARPKSGIMRGREFRMKDLYSFHFSKEDFEDYYFNKAMPAYKKVYERIGLGQDTVVALASGGDFTKEFSHEFQTICESGEDYIYCAKSKDVYYNKEVAPSRAPIIENNDELFEKEDVYGEKITGMDELVKFLKVPAHQCVKTLIYQADNDRVIVAAVRGDYDVNEIKLRNVTNAVNLRLATEDVVKSITNAEVGYAGIINLPESVELFLDDSIEPLKNFECGTNKTNYHTININWDRDLKKPGQFFDIKEVKEGDLYPETNEVYEVVKASEVGNIFPLATKYSDAFNYKFVDKDGKTKPVLMGCYGIGTSRSMGVIVEKFHDDKGIIWPMNIAPFQVHLINLSNDPDTLSACENLYAQLSDQKIEVLWDERDESAGAKLGDADLIGIPIRIVISKRSLDNGGFEVKMRSEDESQIIKESEIVGCVMDKIANYVILN